MDRREDPHGVMPLLTMIRLVAEGLDRSAAISARPGQMEDLEQAASVLRDTAVRLLVCLCPPSSSVDEGSQADELPPE